MVTKVTVTIEKGLVTKVEAPKHVSVIIKDYDIDGYDFTDSEMKTDERSRRYTEEVWEGADA